LAVGLVVAALAVAVAFWPPSPVELGEEWLVETTCVPAEDGVRFTASVHAPATAESQQLLRELTHVVVEVAAHEGGRRVAATEASYPVAAANSGEASVQLVSAATPNPPLALVDVALSAGAVKSPTCAATVIGHR
jgi:hypothetical protein